MVMSEYRKIKIEQHELNRKLDEIATRKELERRAANKISYCMHTPKEAMRSLGERSQTRSWY